MKIFIADNSAIIRKTLGTFLAEIPGVEIVGESAHTHTTLEAIDQAKPHIVILEVHQSSGKGLTLLRSIKHTNASAIVIVFAAQRYPQLHSACINAGADYYFHKTRDFAALTSVLHRLSEQCRALPSGESVSGSGCHSANAAGIMPAPAPAAHSSNL